MPSSSFDLDERNCPLPLDDEIDITVAVPESALDNPPPFSPQPPFRDPLPELAELLRGR